MIHSSPEDCKAWFEIMNNSGSDAKCQAKKYVANDKHASLNSDDDVTDNVKCAANRVAQHEQGNDHKQPKKKHRHTKRRATGFAWSAVVRSLIRNRKRKTKTTDEYETETDSDTDTDNETQVSELDVHKGELQRRLSYSNFHRLAKADVGMQKGSVANRKIDEARRYRYIEI